MINAEEEQALLMARSTRQEERIREEAEVKREEAEKEAEKKRYEKLKGWFELNKAAGIANVISSTAIAIMKIWEQSGVLAPFLTPLAVAAGAAQVAAISSQEFPEKGFSEGGYTGDDKKENEVAGVVHGQEYVVKKGPAQKYKKLLDKMNKDDLQQYMNGGLVNDGGTPLININRDITLRDYAKNQNIEIVSEIRKFK
jgi:hypothetical protein